MAITRITSNFDYGGPRNRMPVWQGGYYAPQAYTPPQQAEPAPAPAPAPAPQQPQPPAPAQPALDPRTRQPSAMSSYLEQFRGMPNFFSGRPAPSGGSALAQQLGSQ